MGWGCFMEKKLPQITHLANWHDRLPRYAFLSAWCKGKKVLDLGCGSGEGAALLAHTGAAEVIAVDPSSATIDEARARYDLPNLRFVAGFVEDPLDLGALVPTQERKLAAMSDDLRKTDVRIPVLRLRETSPQLARPALEVEPDGAPEDIPAPAGDGGEGADGPAPLAAEGQELPSEAPHSEGEAVATQPAAEEEAMSASPEATESVMTESEAGAGAGAGAEAEAEAEAEAHANPLSALLAAAEIDDAPGGDEFPPGDLPFTDSDEIFIATPPPSDYFDRVLVLNPDLPIQDKAFLARLRDMLAPGGFVALSVRIGGSRCISDLLAGFEAGNHSAERVAFASSEAAQAHLGGVFPHIREVEQNAVLTTRFSWPQGEEADGVELFDVAPDTQPRFRIFILSKDPVDAGTDLIYHVPLEPLIAQIDEGLSAMVQRAMGLEHRTVIQEEQLGQKESLIDDLEGELRSAQAIILSHESRIQGMNLELDRLQSELTVPAEASYDAMSDGAGGPQSLLLEQMREAMQAQRLAIDALSLRLHLEVQCPVARGTMADGPAEPADDAARTRLHVALAEKEREILQRERELAQIGAEIQRLTHEAVEVLQSQLSAEEKRSAEVRAQAEAAQTTARVQAEASEKALAEMTASFETAARARQDLSQELARVSQEGDVLRQRCQLLEVSLQEKDALLRALQETVQGQEKILARFRRSRRSKRFADGED